MNWAVDLLSSNKIVVASANVLGILAGLYLLYQFTKFIFRFSKDIYDSNVRRAINRYNARISRDVVICAGDIHIFISRLFLRMVIVFLSFIGMLNSLFARVVTKETLRERFLDQRAFTNYDNYEKFHEIIGTFSIFCLHVTVGILVIFGANSDLERETTSVALETETPNMIQSLLIANRGEIACRIIRSQFLPQRGRGTSEAGGGAGQAGRGGVFKVRRLVFGEGWGVGFIGQLAGAPPPSCGWFPSPVRGGMI